MPAPRLDVKRWRELDARRPHSRYLSVAERIEFEKLDRMAIARMERRT